MYPPLSGGGLIEANMINNEAERWIVGIRRFRAAASLKRERILRKVGLSRRIRRFRAAASLKRPTTA